MENFNITAGRAYVIEEAYITIEVEHGGKIYKLTFYTTEMANDKCFYQVEYRQHSDMITANKIGFKITDEFKRKLYQEWQDYSNKHFR